jgi:tetratricopeptide (TPR) repeat protein
MQTVAERFSPYLALFLALLSLSLNSAAQEQSPIRGRLSLPEKNWGVVLELPGFMVKTVETKPDGRRYMSATNDANGMTVSLTLEQVAAGKKASACQGTLKQKAEHPPAKVKDVSFSRSGDLDVMQYTVPEAMGQPINQRSLFACEFYDNSYIDLHVSKVNYAAADDPLFAAVLNSMHVDAAQRSSRDLMAAASRLYMQQDYKDAIGPYSQALELERASPSLGKPLWYVLIDNLGMSYGITGDLGKAKETFDYGVSKDPTYPLFYYNLACTYAEMNDSANAESYLKKAFAYKANTLPGESMPDPRTDDSFKELIKTKEFRELAESLEKSQ